MRAIVFGGTSFFGKELVEILLKEGHHVTVVTRGNNELHAASNLEFLKANRTNLKELLEVTEGKTWDIGYDQLGFCSNDAEILCKVLVGKISHLVFTSSKSVYDYGEDLEESKVDPYSYELKMGDKAEFDYAEGKRQAEAYYAKKAPFTVGMFRAPVVIGHGDTSKRWNWHLDRISKGEDIYFPNIEAYFCVISSHDAGRVLYKMGKDKVEGPLNYFTANPKLKDILSFMEEGVGKETSFAKEAVEGNHSPYGIENDWYMSRKKAENLGFTSATDFTELAKELSQG